MNPAASPDRLHKALAALVLSAGVCRVVRDEAGEPVDLEFRAELVPARDWRGRTAESMVGRRYSALFPTGLHDRLPAYLSAIRANEPLMTVTEWEQPDGNLIAMEAGIVPFSADEALITLRDVSATQALRHEADAANAALADERSLLEAVLDCAPGPFVILRVRHAGGEVQGMEIEHMNEIAALGTARGSPAWVGVDMREWIGEIGARGLYGHLLTAATSRTLGQARILPRSAGDNAVEADVSIVPFGVDRILVCCNPIGDPAVQPSQQPTVPRHWRDPLTGLLTRGEFQLEFAQWLQRRRPGDPPGAAYVFDLDDFGRINDLVGTQRADLALVAIAAQLRALDPWLLLPARIGADEFAFVLPDAGADADVESVRSHSPRILRQAALDTGLPPLTASVGGRVAEAGLAADEILRDCDIALRASVREGGARLTTYDAQVRRRLMADYLRGEDIRRGLAAGEFQVAFQPIVRVQTSEHVGDEALLRWRHPEHGLVAPDRFIPIAEATGIIVDLGAWVADEAIGHLARAAHRRQVGINVSGAQILRDDVPAVIAAALERHGVAAERVAVELTESAILPDSHRIRDQLAELRQMGVQVAVDDFGSGYSSIAYLDWIPVDLVKLDRQFLLGDIDRRRRSLIAATAQLIRSIGARSLAEGIESAEQFDAVREAGIDYGQGYMFGRPAFPVTGSSTLPKGWRH